MHTSLILAVRVDQRLLDPPEYRSTLDIQHFYADSIAEAHEARMRRAGPNRLDGSELGDTRIAHATFVDR